MNTQNYKLDLITNAQIHYGHVSKRYIILFVVVFMAAISSLGTMPYAFRFAQMIEPYSQSLYYIAGIIFALSAAVANTGLGAYSLLSISKKVAGINFPFLAFISFASAIPTGCMCFFAYHSILPSYLTISVTVAVTLINTGISYTAIVNLILEFRNHRPPQLTRHFEIIIKATFFLIGILSSLAACMAAIHGLTTLFISLSIKQNIAANLAQLIGWCAWIPVAALYANSTKVMAMEIVSFLMNFREKFKSINKVTILLLILAILAGTSFAEIAIDFFRPTMFIPAFFKIHFVQTATYHVIIPLAYFANVGVNYLALRNLTSLLINKT